MDERKLQELFRDAAGTAPPSSFDEQDVLRRSRQVTARRRVAAAGGSLAATVVLVGGLGLTSGWFAPEGPPTAMRPPEQPTLQRPTATERGPGVLMEPEGRSAGGCGAPDGELARALTEALPEAAGQRATGAEECPPGARGVSFALREGTAEGSVTVILAPKGTAAAHDAEPPRRGTEVMRDARSGKVLVVRSEPAGNSPKAPFDVRLKPIAGLLASRF